MFKMLYAYNAWRDPVSLHHFNFQWIDKTFLFISRFFFNIITICWSCIDCLICFCCCFGCEYICLILNLLWQEWVVYFCLVKKNMLLRRSEHTNVKKGTVLFKENKTVHLLLMCILLATDKQLFYLKGKIWDGVEGLTLSSSRWDVGDYFDVIQKSEWWYWTRC